MDQQFNEVMVKAKEAFGEAGYQMAQFYYEHANFIIGRSEKNMEDFYIGTAPADV